LGPGHGRDYKVGTSVPANTPHAVSVSLPLWKDNIDYEEGRLKHIMEIGYPRFFIHKMIQEVSNKMSQPECLIRERVREREGKAGLKSRARSCFMPCEVLHITFRNFWILLASLDMKQDMKCFI